MSTLLPISARTSNISNTVVDKQDTIGNRKTFHIQTEANDINPDFGIDERINETFHSEIP